LDPLVLLVPVVVEFVVEAAVVDGRVVPMDAMDDFSLLKWTGLK
jgi:hypothetical protein